MTALNDFFRGYLKSLQTNTEFRDNLNKQSNHVLDVSLTNLTEQLKFLESRAIKDYNDTTQQFQKDISNLVRDLKNKELQKTVTELKSERTTFAGIRGSFRQKFFDQISASNLQLLKKLGVDIGHVKANLTLASEQKALQEFQKVSVNIGEYGTPLSDKDIEEISKVLAITEIYIGLLRTLDTIQTPQQLESFLRNKNAIYGLSGRKKSFSSLQELKNYITAGAGPSTTKPYADIGKNLLENTIVSGEVNTTFSIVKNLTATTNEVSTTIEIASFNQFKGTIAKEVKNAYVKLLDSALSRGAIAKPDDPVSKKLDSSLVKIIGNSFTKQDVLKIFTSVRASKTHLEALVTSVFSPITKLSPNYTSKSKKILSTAKTQTKQKVKPAGIGVKKANLSKISTSTPSIATINLPMLMLTINNSLHDQIKANMGTGNSRNVLNYRTGRLASSAKVERLSESRQGMITAFYSYMKNPYATFSRGGRQEVPFTRDPKTLISKSIRELAGAQVANRMRAVLI